MDQRTLLITGARAPVALHLARLMQAAGHRVVLADSLARPLGRSTRAATYLRLPSPRFSREACGDALADAIASHGIDLVIPTCEEVFHLALLWASRSTAAPLFAPPMDRLAEVHSKYAFAELCRDIGLDVPTTRLLTAPDDIARLGEAASHMVLKPVWSRFGSQTRIRPKPAQLARISPSPQTPWVAQDFVKGEEICAYAVARDGHLTALAAYRGLVRAGPGASVAFAPVTDPNVTAYVQKLVSATGWTGQISLDLIRRVDGSVAAIECNPRATSGLHFFAQGAGFAAALLDGTPIAPDVTHPLGVPLASWIYGLPKAAKRRRIGPFLRDMRALRDVLDWPDDPGPKRAQIRAMGEMIGIAARHRIGLTQATTYDIEWNGRD